MHINIVVFDCVIHSYIDTYGDVSVLMYSN